MTGVQIFEKAIIEFGVDASLEYFATPKELYSLWDDLKEKEKFQKGVKKLQGGFIICPHCGLFGGMNYDVTPGISYICLCCGNKWKE